MKLVRKRNGETTRQWLFDLSEDLGETSDLSRNRPRTVQTLAAALVDCQRDAAPVR